jgi:hypothetical protein
MLAQALASVVLLASYAITAINAVDPISAVGSKFFYKNGTQYYIKGIQILPSLLVSTSKNQLMLTLHRNCVPADRQRPPH